MKRALFALFAFVVNSTFAKTTIAPEVTFISPCDCQGFHGKNRWVTKTDLSPVPLDQSAIQSVTPSQIYAWDGLGPDVELTATTERMPSEQKCLLTYYEHIPAGDQNTPGLAYVFATLDKKPSRDECLALHVKYFETHHKPSVPHGKVLFVDLRPAFLKPLDEVRPKFHVIEEIPKHATPPES